MKYSYAFKIHCIQLYRRGEWAEVPEGIQKRNFHKMIRLWVRLEEDMIKELKKKINSYDHVVDSHDYRIVSLDQRTNLPS